MQIEPTARKTKCLLAMTAALGGKPQLVMNKIKSLQLDLENNDSEVCGDIGQTVLGDKHPVTGRLKQEVGKFVLGFLKAQEPSDEETWQSLQRLMQDRFLKWRDNPELLKDFSLLMHLPVLTWVECEKILDGLDKMCELKNNAERKVFTKDMKCILVELPQDMKVNITCYVDIIYTRGINLKVTSYATKHTHEIVLPDLPSETTHYNIAVAKNNYNTWMTSRFVFATTSRPTIRKIHDALIEKAQVSNLRDISFWLYRSRYRDLIVSHG